MNTYQILIPNTSIHLILSKLLNLSKTNHIICANEFIITTEITIHSVYTLCMCMNHIFLNINLSGNAGNRDR